MSHQNNAYSVYVLQVRLSATHVHMGPDPCTQLNAKYADIEKALLSGDVTTKVLVK